MVSMKARQTYETLILGNGPFIAVEVTWSQTRPGDPRNTDKNIDRGPAHLL